MQSVMGKQGSVIWHKAQGVDRSAVIPYQERKSISTERTFAKDTIDVVKLEGIIVAMAENLAYQLRRGDKLTSCITVKFGIQTLTHHLTSTNTLHSGRPYTYTKG